MLARLLALLLIAGIYTACKPVTLPAPISSPAALSTPADWDAVLDQFFAPDSKLCDAPGGVLLVDDAQGRLVKAVGDASLETPRAMKADDRFEVGGITKSFTVALALMLQEDGVWSLDDPLSKWLPKVAARLPDGEKITLRQLAGNQSGLRDYADPLIETAAEHNNQTALARTYTPGELVVAGLNRGSSVLEPGQKWNANSTDYILLGMAIEIATNRRLGDLYSTRIFKPLGMDATSYLAESPKAGAIVDGYYTSKKLGQHNVTGWNLSQGGAAGGIVSTAADLAKYVEALATGDLFEKAATVQEMLDYEVLGDAVLKGYGLGVAEFNTSGFESWGHDGKTPGFQSVWFYVPDAKTTVVFLTNSGTCQAGLLPLLTPASLVTPVQ